MNICQFCGQPATIHLTDIVNKKKHESHLCEECARERELIPEGSGSQLNLDALVQMIVGQPTSPASDDLPLNTTCPACGMKYGKFRSEGRFGCAQEYESFRTALLPLLERVHRAQTHRGKIPRRAGSQMELRRLQDDLRAAIEQERFEDAARLRDTIRRKEGSDEPR